MKGGPPQNMAFPAIFFCFEENPNDKPDAPNKIYLDKEAPTLQDFAAALKSVFKIADPLCFRLGDDPNLYADDSPIPAPTNDRNRIVFVRIGGMDGWMVGMGVYLSKYKQQKCQTDFIIT